MKLLRCVRYGKERYYPLFSEGVELLKSFSIGERSRRCFTKMQVERMKKAGLKIEIEEEEGVTRNT